MKVHSMYLSLFMFLIMNCAGGTDPSGEANSYDNRKLLKQNQSEFNKVHSLKNNDLDLIGDVYVKFINDSVFTELYVISDSDTLYSIKGCAFLNNNGIDNVVYCDGFYGYLFVLKGKDYFVLSYLRNKGVNVSDDITIEWNYVTNVLESQKLP